MHNAAYSEFALRRNLSPSKYGFNIKKYAAIRDAASHSNLCRPKASCKTNLIPNMPTKVKAIIATMMPLAIEPVTTENKTETSKYNGGWNKNIGEPCPP